MSAAKAAESIAKIAVTSTEPAGTYAKPSYPITVLDWCRSDKRSGRKMHKDNKKLHALKVIGSSKYHGGR